MCLSKRLDSPRRMELVPGKSVEKFRRYGWVHTCEPTWGIPAGSIAPPKIDGGGFGSDGCQSIQGDPLSNQIKFFGSTPNRLDFMDF